MNILLALYLALSAYSLAPAPGNRFTLEVEKTGIMKGKKHTFSFPKYSGTVRFDAANPENSAVEFTLDASSMVCEDTWVSDSDRQKILAWGLDKMIEAKQHPEIQFVSSRIQKGETNSFQVMGELTMRGVSRPATIGVSIAAATAGNKPLTVNGKATLNMKDWGMKPPTAGLGTVGTKPEMVVRFHLITLMK